MNPRVRALAGLVWLALVLCPVVARGDALPDGELVGQVTITASAEIRGLARFPEHVFYLFPVYCTTPLAALDGAAPVIPGLFTADEYADRPNYLELHDGRLAAWIPEESICRGSVIYALAREVAAGVELGKLSLTALAEFFAGDPRLLRGEFVFLDDPLVAARGSRLRGVHEVIRVLGVDSSGISIVLDAATYRFVDGSEQTLNLGHTRRPDLPFKPLRPEKIAKYAGSYARWEARHPRDMPEPAIASPRPPEIPVSPGPAQTPVAKVAPATVPAGPVGPMGGDGAGASEPFGRAWVLGIAVGVALLGGIALLLRRRVGGRARNG